MTFYQKVKRYQRLANSTEQFGEDYPMPRMLVVLEDGTEIIVEEQGQNLPTWSFKIRFDVEPNSLGAKFNVDDKFVHREKNGSRYEANQQSIKCVELSGHRQDYDAFQKTFWEGIENAAV